MYNLPPKKAYSLSNKHFSQNMKDLTISPSNSFAGEQIPKFKKVNLPPTTTKSSLPLPIKENSIKSLLLPNLTSESVQDAEWNDIPMFHIPHFTNLAIKNKQ